MPSDEEIEDMNFKTYLEALYMEGLFADFERAGLMDVAAFLEDEDGTD